MTSGFISLIIGSIMVLMLTIFRNKQERTQRTAQLTVAVVTLLYGAYDVTLLENQNDEVGIAWVRGKWTTPLLVAVEWHKWPRKEGEINLPLASIKKVGLEYVFNDRMDTILMASSINADPAVLWSGKRPDDLGVSLRGKYETLGIPSMAGPRCPALRIIIWKGKPYRLWRKSGIKIRYGDWEGVAVTLERRKDSRRDYRWCEEYEALRMTKDAEGKAEAMLMPWKMQEDPGATYADAWGRMP